MALNLFCPAKGDVSYRDKGTSPQTALLKNWWKKNTLMNKEQSRTDLLSEQDQSRPVDNQQKGLNWSVSIT